MTTTSPQRPTGEPTPARRGRRRLPVLIAAVVVAAVAVLALAWAFVAGPLSTSARTEREVEQVVRDLGASETLAEFNSHLCGEMRMPQEMLDAVANSGSQTGVDLDAMFREQLLGSFPDDLDVTAVDVEGDDATATVESSTGGDESSGPETLRMRREDGTWLVCEPSVGMGAVQGGAGG